MSPPTLAIPGATSRTRQLLLARMLLTLLFAGLTTLGAHIAIPLPPDGVPMTLQTLVVLLSALCLGPRLGIASMGLYLIIGIAGGAVFAGGEKGIEAIVGQTGGYLVGFIACQPIVACIARRRDGSVRGWLAMIVAVLAGEAVVFGIGLPWFAAVNHFGTERALRGGFYPFIPETVVKAALAVLIGRFAAPLSSRHAW